VTPYYECDGSVLYHGDCLDVLAQLEPDSVDSIVTDPPYGLGFMGVKWDTYGDGKGRSHARKPGGVELIRGKENRKYQETSRVWFIEALRVAKPGAHLLAFGGTRTFHRLACAIEDAGWELRDTIMWVYGTGFPKSVDVSKAIDKSAGVNWRKAEGRNDVRDLSKKEITISSTDGDKQWDGWGTALKPAWEPIIVARKPLIGTVVANVLEHGTGAFNIDGCRVGIGTGVESSKYVPNEKNNVFGEGMGGGVWNNTKGRWPANLIHDGSEEVLEVFPNAPGQQRTVGPEQGDKKSINVFGDYEPRDVFHPRKDSGSAARFFYCAKASSSERGETNTHPTVKPQALMRYLCKLVTPPNGIVLDPFMGSGSTLLAAKEEGFKFVGIDMTEEYCEITKTRLKSSEGIFAL